MAAPNPVRRASPPSPAAMPAIDSSRCSTCAAACRYARTLKAFSPLISSRSAIRSRVRTTSSLLTMATTLESSTGLCASSTDESHCYTRATVLALDDVRILDLSRLLPGAFCTLLLADCGADVIKVEDTDSGDYLRWMPPMAGEYSALFAPYNRNKRSIKLNLKTDGGRDAFMRLVRDADVVVESFRPGVMARLGLDYEALRAVNPGIILGSISGYGQD